MIHIQTSHQRCQSMRLLPCQRINAWEPAFNNKRYCHWAQYCINHVSNGTDMLGKWCNLHTKHYYYRKWNGCMVTILQQNKCPNEQCCHRIGQRNLGKLKTKTILLTTCGGSGGIVNFFTNATDVHISSKKYLDTTPQQCAMSSGPGCQRVFGQAQQPSGFPSDLPDLVPCNLFLFPRLSVFLKGKRFWGHRDTGEYDKVVASHSETGLSHMQ